MTQLKEFSFGIDNVSLVDDKYEVFTIRDAQNMSVSLSGEIAQHRGGTNNAVRASAFHSPTGEITISTGHIDIELANLLNGGSITSLGTSAASVTTGTASGVNTLYGSTATIPTGISTVTINSPTLVKSTDYYIKATDFDEVTVTRLDDGKEFDAVTLTNSADSLTLDSERGIVFSTTADATSLTADEKGIVSVRSAINTVNQAITFDDSKPDKISVVATIDFDGKRQTLTMPVVQTNGAAYGGAAAGEFHLKDLTMQVEWDETNNKFLDIELNG